MVKRVFGIQGDRLLGMNYGIVIIAQFVIAAPQPVICLRAQGILRNGRFKSLYRAPVVPQIEVALRSLEEGGNVGDRRFGDRPTARNGD
jgi:hypothetical protein